MDIFHYARTHNPIAYICVEYNGREALYEDLQSVHSTLSLIGYPVDYHKLIDELEKKGIFEIENIKITC